MRPIHAVAIALLLLSTVVVCGCTFPPQSPSFAPNVYTKTGDWLVHKVDMVLEWKVVETAKYSTTTTINRTATATIKIYPIDPSAVTDQDGDGLPDPTVTSDGVAQSYAYASMPSFQINKFSAGSSVSPPETTLSWSSVMDGSFLPGDTIYIDNNRATGVKRVIVTTENYVNKHSSSVWIVMVPIRIRTVLKNPLDDSIIYDSGAMNIQIPVKLPFDPDLRIGQTYTDTYVRQFSIRILTPFGIVGKYFYDVSIQGTETTTHRTQETNTDTFEYAGWMFLSMSDVVAKYSIFGTLPTILRLEAAAFFVIGALIPDEVGKAVDWGHAVSNYGGQHYLYKGVAS